jgi:hypothetical protein
MVKAVKQSEFELFFNKIDYSNLISYYIYILNPYNNFKWMEDEFEEKYAETMKIFDEMTISTLETVV